MKNFLMVFFIMLSGTLAYFQFNPQAKEAEPVANVEKKAEPKAKPKPKPKPVTKYAYYYNVGLDEAVKRRYTAKYIMEDDTYVTVYKVYEYGNKVAHTVKAYHDKNKKEVKVEVDEGNGCLLCWISEAETDYDVPDRKLFGYRGMSALLQDHVPNQIAVKFVSNKYEHVKVRDIYATPTNSYSMYFYQFDL